MTLEELVSLAAMHNPSISQAAATVAKARGINRQVGLYPNPTIGYTGQEIGDEGTAGQQGAFLSQTIVLGDKLGWNRRVAALVTDPKFPSSTSFRPVMELFR